MNYKFVIMLGIYGLLSIGTFGHALNDRRMSCEEDVEKVLRYCQEDAPLVAMFNSIVWPLYWSYQMHK